MLIWAGYFSAGIVVVTVVAIKYRAKNGVFPRFEPIPMIGIAVFWPLLVAIDLFNRE